jgi:hypothetical protein
MIGILDHMLHYPEAKDTAEGIQRWWLVGKTREFTPAEVAQALDYLAGRGWIVASSFGAVTCVYGISPAGLEQGRAELERWKR